MSEGEAATVADGAAGDRSVPPSAVRVDAGRLERFACALLEAAGAQDWMAEATAAGLCQASLRGTDSHGIRLLPHYLAALGGGRINPRPAMRFEQTAASTGMLDADHGFGHAAGARAMDEAIALARTAGTGFVAVRNSSHCGAMAYAGLKACDHDMIGIAMTHASPKVQSPGARGSFFGINPICVCAPMAGEDPFVYDSAPTLLTSNRLKMYREAGMPLPEGVAADAAGEPTIDPSLAEQLLPIGDYKGFGLAIVVDLFCGLLTAMPAGPKVSMMYHDPLSERRYLGQFYGAIRIDAFEAPDRFKARLKELCDGIRRQEPRPAAGQPPMAPGDPEKHAAAERGAHGIPLSGRLVAELDGCAAELGVERLERYGRQQG